MRHTMVKDLCLSTAVWTPTLHSIINMFHSQVHCVLIEIPSSKIQVFKYMKHFSLAKQNNCDSSLAFIFYRYRNQQFNAKAHTKLSENSHKIMKEKCNKNLYYCFVFTCKNCSHARFGFGQSNKNCCIILDNLHNLKTYDTRLFIIEHYNL